jgi:hypothetical protein
MPDEDGDGFGKPCTFSFEALPGEQALRMLDGGIERGTVRGVVRRLAQRAQPDRKRDRQQRDGGEDFDQREAGRAGEASGQVHFCGPHVSRLRAGIAQK